MNVPLTIAVLLAHALACYGWGRGLSASLRLETDNPAVTVALGLATVIALGGFCNLAGIAYAPTLWTIAGLGGVLGLVALRSGAAKPRSPGGLTIVALGLSVLTCVLVVSTLVPPWAFNYHDDYQKYFAHPARMLQTGTLTGSSGSALGFETLGGQAFLHGFALSWGRFDALNAVDLGFCWPLCIALAGFWPAASGFQAALRVIAMVLVFTLNPQIVNVSATYSASALCLAWIELGRSQELQTALRLRSYACASGVLFAGLCALKTTFLLLGTGLFGLTVCALCGHVGLRRALLWAATALGAWLVLLLPWLGVHARLLTSHSDVRLLDTLARAYRVDVLSTEPLLYGGDSFAMYTFGVTVCAVLAWYGWRRAPLTAAGPPWSAWLSVSCAACLALTYFVMLYVVAPRSQGAVTTVRLFVPMFIGLAAGCVTLTAQNLHARTLGHRLAPLVLALALCVPFARSLGTRCSQALRAGSILAFPYLAENEHYIRYNYDVLYGSYAKRTALAQAAVPLGAPLIAIVNTPFWLDYKRNPIADIEPAGLATPWSRIPQAQYVLWEYNGFATVPNSVYEQERDRPSLLQARIGDAGLRLTSVLFALARTRTTRVLHNDGRILVLELPTSSTLSQAYAATSPTR